MRPPARYCPERRAVTFGLSTVVVGGFYPRRRCGSSRAARGGHLNTRQSHPASVLAGVRRLTYVLGFGEDPIGGIESAGSAEEAVTG